MILHDNTHPHIAARTRALQEQFSWELFDPPPHSPDLSPSDYHLFTRTYLKNWLGSQHFNNNEELMESVKTWLCAQAANFFDTGISSSSFSVVAPTWSVSHLCNASFHFGFLTQDSW
jgi:hypothetical protein